MLHGMMIFFQLYEFSIGREAAGTPVARQVEKFMESKSTSVLSLKDHPHVARAFVKANSTVHCPAVQL